MYLLANNVSEVSIYLWFNLVRCMCKRGCNFFFVLLVIYLIILDECRCVRRIFLCREDCICVVCFFLFCVGYSCFFVLYFVLLDIFLLCHVFPVLWLYSMERIVERIVFLYRLLPLFEWNLYVYATIGYFSSGYLLFICFQVRTLQVY